MNKIFRFVPKTAALVSATFVGASHAVVPASVTAAITEMQADGVLIAGAVLVAIIAVMAVKFLRKGM